MGRAGAPGVVIGVRLPTATPLVRIGCEVLGPLLRPTRSDGLSDPGASLPPGSGQTPAGRIARGPGGPGSGVSRGARTGSSEVPLAGHQPTGQASLGVSRPAPRRASLRVPAPGPRWRPSGCPDGPGPARHEASRRTRSGVPRKTSDATNSDLLRGSFGSATAAVPMGHPRAVGRAPWRAGEPVARGSNDLAQRARIGDRDWGGIVRFSRYRVNLTT